MHSHSYTIGQMNIHRNDSSQQTFGASAILDWNIQRGCSGGDCRENKVHLVSNDLQDRQDVFPDRVVAARGPRRRRGPETSGFSGHLGFCGISTLTNGILSIR